MPRYSLKTVYFIFVLISFSSPYRAYAFEGPLNARNQFPLFMHLNPLSFETARLEDSYSLSLSHSTLYVVKNSDEWSMGLDMEITELKIRARKSFFDSFELGIDLPFISFNAGFLDSPNDFYHNMMGLTKYGRENRPQNDFLYEVKRNGVTIVQGEGGSFGISDIRLSAKKSIILSDPVISLKVDIELPTGDAKKGYGNGYPGTDVSVLLDKSVGHRFMTYANAGMAFPGDLDGYEKVSMKQFIYGGIAAEMRVWKGLNLVAQLSFQGSPYPKTGVRDVDATAALLDIGARYTTLNNDTFELAFTEDPNTAGATDCTVELSYKKRF